ncbi:MAG: hypothetical protein IPI67_38725 [Myxococcales bacterium]|nr:hypothetical protein [Myxococcales bacterium]
MLARGWKLLLVSMGLGSWLLLLSGCNRCRTTDDCRDRGQCTSRGEACIATEDSDCRASEYCSGQGRCKAQGKCIAASEDDCRASVDCKARGKCFLRNNLCCTQDGPCQEYKPPPALPRGVKGEEGCPCGCDHSEQMAAELLSGPPADAAAAIARSLAAISEREDAGYITEAMIEHRLRLLSVARQLGFTVEPRPSAPRPTGDSPPLTRESATLRAAVDLVVHGEHSELVHGREKLLRAAYRAHVRLENLTERPLTLARPELHGAMPFPVARWYVLGSDGRPFDGVLGAREKRSVYLIGYLRSDVSPGDELDATLTVEGLAFDLHARARRKWYGLTGDDSHSCCEGHGAKSATIH